MERFRHQIHCKGSGRPRWRYRIDAGKDEQGSRIQEGHGGFAKEGEDRNAMKTHMDEIQVRTAEVQEAPRTLGQWLTEWLDTYAPDRCQPKTIDRYRQLAEYVTVGAASELAAIALPGLSQRLFPPGVSQLFAFSSESCSPSPRNAFRSDREILFCARFERVRRKPAKARTS